MRFNCRLPTVSLTRSRSASSTMAEINPLSPTEPESLELIGVVSGATDCDSARIPLSVADRPMTSVDPSDPESDPARASAGDSETDAESVALRAMDVTASVPVLESLADRAMAGASAVVPESLDEVESDGDSDAVAESEVVTVAAIETESALVLASVVDSAMDCVSATVPLSLAETEFEIRPLSVDVLASVADSAINGLASAPDSASLVVTLAAIDPVSEPELGSDPLSAILGDSVTVPESELLRTIETPCVSVVLPESLVDRAMDVTASVPVPASVVDRAMAGESVEDPESVPDRAIAGDSVAVAESAVVRAMATESLDDSESLVVTVTAMDAVSPTVAESDEETGVVEVPPAALFHRSADNSGVVR